MGEIEQATKKLTPAEPGGRRDRARRRRAARLNLSAAELQALPLDQRIALIQDAAGRFVPEAERAAVASQLFGDRAALAFLRIDTATLRQARRTCATSGWRSAPGRGQIERTNDAISRLA
jgi:hypothetical protein